MSNSEIQRENVILKISEIKEYEKNARYHTDEQLEDIEASIKEFGFTNPILLDENKEIIAGHGRRIAAIGIGMEDVPCVMFTGLTNDQKKALRLADNRIPQNAKWNFELLVAEVQGLYNGGYDINLLGFDNETIDKMLAACKFPDDDTDDTEDPEVPDADPETSEDNDNENIEPDSSDNEEGEELNGLKETVIKIKIPAKYKDQVIDYLSGKENKTPGGMGLNILKSLELL